MASLSHSNHPPCLAPCRHRRSPPECARPGAGTHPAPNGAGFTGPIRTSFLLYATVDARPLGRCQIAQLCLSVRACNTVGQGQARHLPTQVAWSAREHGGARALGDRNRSSIPRPPPWKSTLLFPDRVSRRKRRCRRPRKVPGSGVCPTAAIWFVQRAEQRTWTQVPLRCVRDPLEARSALAQVAISPVSAS